MGELVDTLARTYQTWYDMGRMYCLFTPASEQTPGGPSSSSSAATGPAVAVHGAAVHVAAPARYAAGVGDAASTPYAPRSEAEEHQQRSLQQPSPILDLDFGGPESARTGDDLHDDDGSGGGGAGGSGGAFIVTDERSTGRAAPLSASSPQSPAYLSATTTAAQALPEALRSQVPTLMPSTTATATSASTSSRMPVGATTDQGADADVGFRPAVPPVIPVPLPAVGPTAGP